MSSGNYERVTYQEESTWNGSLTGSIKEVPHTGANLARSAQFTESRIVRSDRVKQDIARGSFSAGGTVGMELIYRKTSATTQNAYDDWLKWLLFADADWTSPQSDVTGADSTSTTVTKTNAFPSGWAVGDWVRVTVGTAAPSYQLITAKGGTGSDDSLTLSPGGLATGTGNVTVEHGSYVKNGTTRTSFQLTRSFLDITNTSAIYPGCVVDGLSLQMGLAGPITGSWSLVCYDEEAGSSHESPASGQAASGLRVFDSVGGAKLFATGQPLASFSAMSMSMQIGNAIRARREIVAGGIGGAVDVVPGEFSVTGSYTKYFAANSDLAAFLANTESAFAIGLQDPAGNAYVMWLPSAVLTGGARTGGGKDADIEAQIQWSAKISATYGECMRITRFDA
jgi:hypothetical protein